MRCDATASIVGQRHTFSWPARDEYLRRQSTCAPDALMMGAHFASSALTKSAVVWGVEPGVGSTPAFRSESVTAGSASALLMAALSLLTIGCGVPAGARIAFQV